jgi:hypothetical protein
MYPVCKYSVVDEKGEVICAAYGSKCRLKHIVDPKVMNYYMFMWNECKFRGECDDFNHKDISFHQNEKCRFGNDCVNSDCKRSHPSNICNLSILGIEGRVICGSGKKCNLRHALTKSDYEEQRKYGVCYYGDRCVKFNCKLRHPHAICPNSIIQDGRPVCKSDKYCLMRHCVLMEEDKPGSVEDAKRETIGNQLMKVEENKQIESEEEKGKEKQEDCEKNGDKSEVEQKNKISWADMV